MERARARERFAQARVARLASVGADGGPHIVPVVFALEGETVYSVVDSKPKRSTRLRRLENLQARPAAALLADHYEEDWSRLWWVRADGYARVLEPGREEEADRAIELLSARYPQQRAAGLVLAVDVDRWSGWSAAES